MPLLQNRNMNIKKEAHTYLVLSIVLGAMVPVMLDLASSINIYEFLFLTYAISAIASLLYVLAKGKRNTLIRYLKSPKQFSLIAVIGILNYALLEFGMTYAERFVSVPLATAIYRTFPILMLMFIPFVLRERISKYQFAALALGFAGLFIALSGGTLQIFSNPNPVIMVLLVAIALAAAIGNLLVKKYSYDVESGMVVFSIANLAVFFLLFAANGFPESRLTIAALVPILYVGIVYNLANGIMFWKALRTLKTTLVTNTIFLSPFFTFVFAYLILKQPVQPYYIATAALVAAGIFIQHFDKVGGTYSASSKKHRRFTIFDVTGAFAQSGELGISTSIENGGRVLAAKLDSEHQNHLNGVIESSGYTNVFTDLHVAAHESAFVRDILDADENSLIVLKAGNTEEGEKFFDDLSERIDGSERNL